MDSSAVSVTSVATDALGDSSAVDGDVATAHHQHALALHSRVVLPVPGPQERQRPDDSLGACAWQRKDSALLQPRRDEHGVVLADQVVDRHVVAKR